MNWHMARYLRAPIGNPGRKLWDKGLSWAILPMTLWHLEALRAQPYQMLDCFQLTLIGQFAEAIACYEPYAEKGKNIKAQYNLGVIYEK